MRFDETYFNTVTRCVEEAEARTTAELVVAIQPHSGNYRDVDYLFGGVVALAGLAFIVLDPWTTYHPYAILCNAVVLFMLGAWVCSALPTLRRRLSAQKRREGQVREAAAALFVQEGVSHTRARTGVLIYLSLLERQVEIIADVGITSVVQPDVWNARVFELKKAGAAPDPAAALLDSIRQLSGALALALPPGEDNPDEIPNRPRTGK